jgi:hypothetical protein
MWVADDKTAAAVTKWSRRVEAACKDLVDADFLSKGQICVRSLQLLNLCSRVHM